MGKAAKKEKKRKTSDGKGKGILRKFRRGLLIAVLAAAAAGLGITFIPEDKIPKKFQGFYDKCLTVRNTVIARSGLPVSRYEDSITVRINETPDVKIYFGPSPVIDKGLCQFIDSAIGTVDVCIYDLDLYNVTDSLIRAKKRGVQVRAVTDTDNFHLVTIDKLQKAGITVRQDQRPAIMHNKFVIADMKKVWTGSYNFTINGTSRNDNNAVILESPGIAACYRDKFEEYFSGQFGQKANKRTANGKLIVGSLPVQVAFAPADQVSFLILDHLRYAKKSIRMMAFSFTSQQIANELAQRAKNGVRVQCLFDYGQAKSKFSQDDRLKGYGVQIRLSPNRRGKMHHKVIIIDSETVITGSYNFSKNADKSNDENVMILRNKEIARHYINEFNRCWKGTKGY